MLDGAAILESLSPWHAYLAGDPVGTGRVPGGVALLAVLTLLLAGVGLARFERRDLMV
jgi:hypothetical protein